jgi:hypothetical protein
VTAGFLAEMPLRTARRYVDAELGGKATPAQVRWLHEHPVLWLRALHQVKQDVQHHIAKDRNDLGVSKPRAGERVSAEYLRAKEEHDRRSTGRIHFQRLVETRIAEVLTLVGGGRVHITGDLVNTMVRLAQLIDDDDVQAARDLALYYAGVWAKAAEVES